MSSIPFFDLTGQHASIREAVEMAVREVAESQRFILGPVVERFEAEVATYVGARHAVGCASGTDALLLALKALELEPRDEVVVPAFTFFATAGAVWNAGLRPVFCDIDPDTFNVSAETLAPALSERTRAIIPVHLYGQMAEMGPLMDLAERQGLAVIEDAAQAFGARRAVSGQAREAGGGERGPGSVADEDRVNGNPGECHQAGSIGTMGCFSFFPTKNLGGWGDGGMIVTDDDALAERLRKLRVHGGKQMYHHELIGTNSRLDAIQAAVLSAKLPHLDDWLEARRANAGVYDEGLRELAQEVRIPVALPNAEHTYNQYTVRAERRDELRGFLGDRGIGSAIYYPAPLHLQECFAELGYGEGDLPECERACREVLSLPAYPELGESRAEQVSESISAFYQS